MRLMTSNLPGKSPRGSVVTVFLWLAAAVTAQADVTLQYSYEIKPGPMLPPQAVDAISAHIKRMTEMGGRIQLKGNRALSNVMGMTSISDFDGEMITLINPKHAVYATAQKDEYLRAVLMRHGQQLKQMTADARNTLDQLKWNVKTENTGQTLSIQGIDTEERLITMTMEMPGAPTTPMRIVFSLWTPKDAEMNRNPVLREWGVFAQRAYLGTDPAAAAQKLSMEAPAMGFASRLMDAFKQFPVVLQTRMSMMGPRMTAGQSSADASPSVESSTIMELVMNLDELSDAEVPEAVFQIPRDYSVVPMEEVLTKVVEQFAPPKPDTQRAPMPEQPPSKLILRYKGSHPDKAATGVALTLHKFAVANFADYGDELFRPAPSLPPCGLNNEASRTWVEVIGDNGQQIYGFCALKAAAELQNLSFAIARGETSPKWVRVVLNDRQTGNRIEGQLNLPLK